MRLIIAILLPWLLFFTIGRPFAGIMCLILQPTLIGWVPAALWAVYALNQYHADAKLRALQASIAAAGIELPDPNGPYVRGRGEGWVGLGIGAALLIGLLCWIKFSP